MSRRIFIGWIKQKSGKYALKGITITEDDRSYDAASTFREEDAKWLSKVIGAKADVEFSVSLGSPRVLNEYPDWARQRSSGSKSDVVTPLDWERANAALFRDFLSRLIEEFATTKNSAKRQKLTSGAKAGLLATDAGTYYTPDQARSMVSGLNSYGQKQVLPEVSI